MTLTRDSNSTPIATWSIKDGEGAVHTTAPKEDLYPLPADGMAQAVPTLAEGVGPVTWSFSGDSLGCTLTTAGVLTAGTNVGTV